MFSLVNGIYDNYLAPTELTLLVVGAPESGKTSLLERLKVTKIRSKPQRGTGGDNTVQHRISTEELPAALRAALLETGAAEGRHNRSLSRTSLASGSSSYLLSTTASDLSMQFPAQSPPAVTSRKMPKTAVPPNTSTGNGVVVAERKKRFSFCPAPERYLRSVDDQDEEIVDEKVEDILLDGGDGDGIETKSHSLDAIFGDTSFSNSLTGDPPQRVRCHSKEFDVDTLDLLPDGIESMDLTTSTNDNNNGNDREASMQSIGLDNGLPLSPVINKKVQSTSIPLPRPFQQQQQQQEQQQHEIGPPLLQTSSEEYDVKPKAKMLPLRMIRPTIGTNLAKLEMYGTKCHIFDVGGRLQDLWKRYYDDCDAVVFCWKLGEDPDKPPKEPDSDDDSDAEEEDVYENVYKKQQKLLNSVRKSIPDDVPFLILGHVFGKASSEIVDTMYSTDLLLPRYHNPITGFCCSSAKTGAGVQSAMEWLIPLAKRQQKERIATKRELDMMLEEQGKTL